MCMNKTIIGCDEPDTASQSIVGIIFLVANCSCMAMYVLLQKRFVFGRSWEDKNDDKTLGKWDAYPVHLTAYSYLFGAMIMATTAGVRYGINQDSSVFNVPKETYAAIGYAVFISSALAYGLITFANKYVSSVVVTAFWPVQVFVTIILSYVCFNDKMDGMEYGGMALILVGMFIVVYSNITESKDRSRRESPIFHRIINSD
eukprot:m.79744 g.79744  ORF g.79744 m.79744 type:complete len:202 (-) comp11987_c0_seq6:83-688(-)